MSEIDFVTVLNTFLRSHNLERLLTPFLDGTEVQKREAESLKPFLPAFGISLGFSIFERFLADHYNVHNPFQPSSAWANFEKDINLGWKLVRSKFSYKSTSTDFYGWNILRNLHKLRHSMMHAYGRMGALNSGTIGFLTNFRKDLVNGKVLNRNNEKIAPYYDIVKSSKNPNITYLVYEGSSLQIFREVMQDLIFSFNLCKGKGIEERIKFEYI